MPTYKILIPPVNDKHDFIELEESDALALIQGGWLDSEPIATPESKTEKTKTTGKSGEQSNEKSN